MVVVFFGAAALGAGISAALVKRGTSGPPGATGAVGPRGPRGHTGSVDSEGVLNAVESDPDRVAQAIQDNLDPSPDDVQSNVDDVSGQVDDLKSNFDGLCSSLQLSDGLSGDVIDC